MESDDLDVLGVTFDSKLTFYDFTSSLGFQKSCNPIQYVYGALSVPVQVTCSALVALRYTYAPPRSTA